MARERLTIEILANGASLTRTASKGKQDLKGLERATKTVGTGFATSAKSALKFGAASAGFAGVGAAIGFVVKSGMGFEKQMSALKSVSGATGQEMARFKKEALDAGLKTAFSAREAAEAQTELAKGGLTVAQISGGGLKGALALAAAGELRLADAAAYTSNALNLFQMRGSKAGHVADALATAANATTADVGDFGQALTQGGAAARSAGLSFDQTMVALEALAKSGVKGSDAGTSLKTALIQLIKPTKQQQEAAAKAGLSFTDNAGKLKSLSAISGMLRSKTENMTKAQRTALFATLAGTDGVRTLLSLYDAGPARLDKFAAGLRRQGTAADVARQKQDNLAGRWEAFKGTMETLAIIAYGKMKPALERAVGALDTFFSGMMTGQGAGGAVLSVLSAIGSAAVRVGSALSSAASAAGPLFSFLGSLGRMGAAFASSATGATVLRAALGAIGGLMAANAARAAAWLAILAVGKVIAFASAIRNVGGAMVALRAAMASNPLGLILSVVGAAAGALGLFGGRQSQAAASASQLNNALNAQRNALLALQGATLGVSEAKHQQAAANTQVRVAEKFYQDTVKKSGSSSLAARQAHDALVSAKDQLKRSGLQVAESEKSQANETKKVARASKQASDMASQRVRGLKEERAEVDKRIRNERDIQGNYKRTSPYLQSLYAKHRQLTSEIAKTSRSMGDSGQAAIAMSKRYAGVPKLVKTVLRTDDKKALSQLNYLTGRLDKVAGKKTTTRILAQSNSAEDAIQRVLAKLASMPASKTTTLTTIERRIIQGKVAGPINPKHRAKGGEINKPEFALIGEAGREFVIPVQNHKSRGRALAAQAVAELGGIAMFEKGAVRGGAAKANPKTKKLKTPKRAKDIPGLPSQAQAFQSLWERDYAEKLQVYDNLERNVKQSPLPAGELNEIIGAIMGSTPNLASGKDLEDKVSQLRSQLGGPQLSIGEIDQLIGGQDSILTMLKGKITNSAESAHKALKEYVRRLDQAIKQLEAAIRDIEDKIAATQKRLKSLRKGKRTKRKEKEISRYEKQVSNLQEVKQQRANALSKAREQRRTGIERRNDIRNRLDNYSASDSIKQAIEDTEYNKRELQGEEAPGTGADLSASATTGPDTTDTGGGVVADAPSTEDNSGLVDLLKQQLMDTKKELLVSQAQSMKFVGFFKKGGIVPDDGMAYVHKGETVIPAGQGIAPTVQIHISGDRALAEALEKAIDVTVERTSRQLGSNIIMSLQTPITGRKAAFARSS